MIDPILEYAQRYPFSNEAAQVLKGVDLENIPHSQWLAAKELVIKLAEAKNPKYEISSDRDIAKQNITKYVLAKILTALTKSDTLKRRFAGFFAEYAYKNLNKENLTDMAIKHKIPIDIPKNKEYAYKLNIFEYLRKPLPDGLHLIDVDVDKGDVYLSEERFKQFMKNWFYWNIYNSFNKDYSQIGKNILQMAQEIKDNIYTAMKIPALKGKQFKVEYLPPCMRKMYKDLISGSMPSHLGNVAFASFLIAIGLDEDAIMEIYKHSAKFDEKTARYQIRYLQGKSGRGKQYAPPSCQKMADWHLCRDKDALCDKVKTPLFYYIRKARIKHE